MGINRLNEDRAEEGAPLSTHDRPGRIPYIDGLRGYLIFSMTLSHLGIIGPNLFADLSHKTVSAFFTGEGFMTISGLMMGYILARPTQTDGTLVTLGNSLRRSFKIFRHYIVVFALCALAFWVFAPATDDLLASLFRGRNPLTPEAALLFVTGLYRPLMFDILFLYIVLIGIAPVLIGIALRYGSPALLGLSMTSWLAFQYGFVTKVVEKLGAVFAFDPAEMFGSFSIFSWQLPFVIGLLLGITLALQDQKTPQRLADLRKNAFPFAVTICLAFAFFGLLDAIGVISLGHVFFADYLRLDPLTLINFFAFALVLACLLAANADDPNRTVRGLHKGLAAFIDNRLFTTIGSNSLLTFSASVVLTYWVIGMREPLFELLGPFVGNTLAFSGVMGALYVIVILDRHLRRR
ncbi:hypothetical protein SAMN04488036_10470 [Shimia haliotis]|uniref:OpgC protein n=1 Tax=Shimia haliotis TaxID=1280847 RepID=A0A1I4EAT3_9RHOB|nr:hypothetical protein SAMN04488036_10470 [Shimia haliotis]